MERDIDAVVIALKRKRLRLRLTQGDVTRLMGIPDQAPLGRTLNRLETGYLSRPSFDLVRRYAEAVGMELRLVDRDAP